MVQSGDDPLRTVGWGPVTLPAERRRMQQLRDKYELLASEFDVEAQNGKRGLKEIGDSLQEATLTDRDLLNVSSVSADVATGDATDTSDEVGHGQRSADPSRVTSSGLGADRPRRAGRYVPDDLVAAAVGGDRDAAGRLLEVIRPLVARYVRGRLGATDRSLVDTDDVTQEVCLAVLTALPNYQLRGKPFLSFVYGIAAHKVIDARRAVARRRSDPVADLPDSVDIDAGIKQSSTRGEPSMELRNLLGELPEKQREILLLRVVVGLSAEETAEIVGSSPGAVRITQHRALGRLGPEKGRTLKELTEDLSFPASAYDA